MLQFRSTAFHRPAPPSAEGPTLRLLGRTSPDAYEEAAWHDLGRAAEAPSVFAEPWLMRRSLTHCDRGQSALLAVVEGESGQWLGAMPVTAAARQGRSPVPAWIAWSHPNQFVGTPLVRDGYAEAFWRALLDGLSRHGRGRLAIQFGQLPTDDPVTQALLRVCAAQGRTVVIDQRVERARLDARAGVAIPDQCPKQRSRIRGLERKLMGEVGEAAFDVVREPDRIAAALDEFLRLEKSGWKGRAGSALASADATRAFFLDVARTAAARGRLEVATLTAGDRMIAMSTQLGGADRIYGFKAAYDEAFARYAPGLLLLDRLTRHYLERGAGEIDSCAVPSQQPVSRLWPARRELIDCRVALGGPVRARLFAAMLACERASRKLRRSGTSLDK